MIQERQQMVLSEHDMVRVDFFKLFHESRDSDSDPYPFVPDQFTDQTVERRVVSVHVDNIFEKTILHIV